jgi:hypothetical protein
MSGMSHDLLDFLHIVHMPTGPGGQPGHGALMGRRYSRRDASDGSRGLWRLA